MRSLKSLLPAVVAALSVGWLATGRVRLSEPDHCYDAFFSDAQYCE
jgi:hypothetical protein